MKSVICAFCMTLLAVAGSAQAATITIDFNGFTASDYLPSPTVVSGFTLTGGVFGYIGNPGGSPSKTMTNGDGSNFFLWDSNTPLKTLTISRATAFNLDSLLLGTLDGVSGIAKYDIIAASITTLSGNANGTLTTPTFTNLTSVQIRWAGNTVGNETLAIDNIVLSDYIAPAAVPEPASVLFLGLGVCLAGVRHVRRKRAIAA